MSDYTNSNYTKINLKSKDSNERLKTSTSMMKIIKPQNDFMVGEFNKQQENNEQENRNNDVQSIDLSTKSYDEEDTEKIVQAIMTRIKRNKRQIVPLNTKENIAKLSDKYRQHIYSCLCVFLNTKLGSYSISKFFFKSLCAYPCYFSTLILILVLGIIGVLSFYAASLASARADVVNNSYFAKCTSNSFCNTLAGLGCSGENNLCNCPGGYTKGRCDCSLGTYWNGTRCTPWIQYQQRGCAGDYSCDRTKELKCVNQTCQCVPPKYWNSSSSTCDFTFLGCFNDNTGLGSSVISSQNIYRKMYYFIDTCTNYCRNLNNIYSLVWIGNGNSTYCWCASAYTALLPVSCDTLCLGKNSKNYWCGNSNANPSYRAVYLN